MMAVESCAYGPFETNLGSLAVMTDAKSLVRKNVQCAECMYVYECAFVCGHAQRMFDVPCYVYDIVHCTT